MIDAAVYEVKTKSKVYLICGRTGAGKSTLAKQMEMNLSGFRISHDELLHGAYGEDIRDNEFPVCCERINRIVWQQVERFAALGIDVILEGWGGRALRDQARKELTRIGVDFRFIFVACPADIRLERVKMRNEASGGMGVFISETNFNRMEEIAEEFDPDEKVTIVDNSGPYMPATGTGSSLSRGPEETGERPWRGDTATIREAAKSDSLQWSHMRSEFWPGRSHADEIAEFFAGNAHEPVAVFVAAGGNGELLGFAEVSSRMDYVPGAHARPVAYIEGMFVRPDFRRMGLGRRLLTYAERWAAGKGFFEIGSDADFQNEPSIATHVACGFREVGSVVHFIKKVGASRSGE